MTARRSRHLVGVRWSSLCLAVVLAVMAMGVPAGAAPVQAAAEPLRLAVAATYRIDPAGHAVHVALDITATNNKPNTARPSTGTTACSSGSRPRLVTSSQRPVRRGSV